MSRRHAGAPPGGEVRALSWGRRPIIAPAALGCSEDRGPPGGHAIVVTLPECQAPAVEC